MDDEGLAEPLESKGTFRYTSAKVFLTYSQADGLTASDIITALQELGYYKGIVGTEHHIDGGLHYHVIAFNAKAKTDIKNVRYWDVGGKHPNVRHVKSVDRCFAYLTKDGTFESWGNPDVLLAKGQITGFCNRKKDLEEFVRYVRSKTAKSPFPISLPYLADEFVIEEPSRVDRQRCLYIYGAPNTGKSKYFTDIADGTSTYYPVDGELAYDAYGGEILVVYDDKMPPLQHLIQLLNYSKSDRPCPGRQRYCVRTLRGQQARFVVIIMNRLIPWEIGCTNSFSCNCPGCTRTIYYNWDKHFVSRFPLPDDERINLE